MIDNWVLYSQNLIGQIAEFLITPPIVYFCVLFVSIFLFKYLNDWWR